MSESEESLDSVDVEYEMLVEECKELLKKITDEPKQEKNNIESFESCWQELMKEKKIIEDQIADVQMECRKK